MSDPSLTSFLTKRLVGIYSQEPAPFSSTCDLERCSLWVWSVGRVARPWFHWHTCCEKINPVLQRQKAVSRAGFGLKTICESLCQLSNPLPEATTGKGLSGELQRQFFFKDKIEEHLGRHFLYTNFTLCPQQFIVCYEILLSFSPLRDSCNLNRAGT